MRGISRKILVGSLLGLAASGALAQTVPAAVATPQSSFEAATIKPPDPKARGWVAGFYGSPGGRVFFGGNLHMLVSVAFGAADYQVAGGPKWMESQWFEINAVPPPGSASLGIKVRNANPTAEQMRMLQNLLTERFAFKYHFEDRQGEVYELMRGSKPLALNPPKDPAADPRAIVYIRSDGIHGDAVGINTTLDYLAQRLSGYLRLPVENRTGIAGAYDFELAADDPGEQDLVAAVQSVVGRLGLKLKRGRGMVRTLVIDSVEQPTEN